MAYTPGTKMPEQQIGSAEDRAALMKFLEKATIGGRGPGVTARDRVGAAPCPRDLFSGRASTSAP